MAKLGKQETIGYEEFMAQSLKAEHKKTSKVKKPKKSAEEILAEFAPIVERDSREE